MDWSGRTKTLGFSFLSKILLWILYQEFVEMVSQDYGYLGYNMLVIKIPEYQDLRVPLGSHQFVWNRLCIIHLTCGMYSLSLPNITSVSQDSRWTAFRLIMYSVWNQLGSLTWYPSTFLLPMLHECLKPLGSGHKTQASLQAAGTTADLLNNCFLL